MLTPATSRKGSAENSRIRSVLSRTCSTVIASACVWGCMVALPCAACTENASVRAIFTDLHGCEVRNMQNLHTSQVDPARLKPSRSIAPHLEREASAERIPLEREG